MKSITENNPIHDRMVKELLHSDIITEIKAAGGKEK